MLIIEKKGLKSMITKFPKVLAAARQIELDQWQLGDALIEECGEPGSRGARANGVNTGDFALLQAVSEYLAEYGLNYSINYLSRLRNTAFDFPKSKRKANLSWSAHFDAGDPETLKTVVQGAPKGTRITRDLVRGLKFKAWQEQTPPPTDGRQVPIRRPELRIKPERVSADIISLEIEGALDKAKEFADEAFAKFEQHNQILHTVIIDGIHAQAVELIETGNKLAKLARSIASNKRSHLSVIGE